MLMVLKACKKMSPEKNICKAQLDYPCQWLYKVIGTDHEKLLQAINEIVTSKPCEINLSNTSSKGKYLCLNLEVNVESEGERNAIYLDLKMHPHVKIVL